jgi:hypothetical protein
MTRSRLQIAGALGAAAAAAATGLLLPAPALGHAIGQVFTLPVPLALYLAGAALAVAASFVVSVVVVRPAGQVPGYPTLGISAGVSRVASVLLQALGLIWWLSMIVAGFLADSFSPLPALLFWIGFWIGLPITAVVFGNPWPSLSPFRTMLWLLERLARLVGLDRLDAGLRYPRALGRWPAVLLLFAALWAELVLPGRQEPRAVGALLLGYTVITVVGMVLFGRVAWLRNAELFEVLFGWFGRLGPIGRRAEDPSPCEGCTEDCDPRRCIDCPECATAAEPGERRAELRPWFTGLTEVRSPGWTDVVFIVLALAGVTFDGLRETSFWGGLTQPIFMAIWEVVGPGNTILLIETGGLVAVWLVFLAAFIVAVQVTRTLQDRTRNPQPFGPMAGVYASTLLPIAAGYVIAHYLTVLVQGIVWLPELIRNPLQTVAPALDWIPISAVWYLSVGAIVLGHVVAVVLAHRAALRDSPSRPILAGLPLVALMVGYTVLSLWIIAAPITLEPGVMPATQLGP